MSNSGCSECNGESSGEYSTGRSRPGGCCRTNRSVNTLLLSGITSITSITNYVHVTGLQVTRAREYIP